MRQLYHQYLKATDKLRDVPLLLIRLILVVGFYEPALMKVKNLQGVAEWFGSMNYPLPFVSALLAMLVEVTGIVLLVVGLGTRIIAIPLMVVMLVAIFTVHIHGFSAGNNGFEIPLYYILMLFLLMVYGAGKISLDHLIQKGRSDHS